MKTEKLLKNRFDCAKIRKVFLRIRRNKNFNKCFLGVFGKFAAIFRLYSLVMSLMALNLFKIS